MSFTGRVTELRYQAGTSNKFYRVYEIKDTDSGAAWILLNWGRWGATGQFKAEKFSSGIGAARTFAWVKIEEKSNKGYTRVRDTDLPQVPEDLLARLDVPTPVPAPGSAATPVDLFAGFAADADRLIRMVTGPAELSADAIVLHADLKGRLGELQRRLEESTGQLELADDVIRMKAGA
jgi:predicted DNA-binding WGR domain protein